MKKQTSLEQTFKYWHKNPPAPFNPDYDPKAEGRFERASRRIEHLEPFASRENRAAAWRRAYEELKVEEEG